MISAPGRGPWNMALDEALLARAQATNEGVLRIYAWDTPTLSLGRNQIARGAYDLARAQQLGVEFVRRPTGGRALLHHREVTYSVTAPAERLGDLRESYARVNRLLIEGLHALGVPAEASVNTGGAPPPDTAPCFELPVSGEIVASGRKLVGSAQLRDDGAMLQHGSILQEDDQSLAAELLAERQTPPPAPATLTGLLGRTPSAAEVALRLVEALHTLEDPAARPLELDARLETRAREAMARYQDEVWTWRR